MGISDDSNLRERIKCDLEEALAKNPASALYSNRGAPKTTPAQPQLNNKYIIRIEHPLVRPGLSIETEASENYLAAVVSRLMVIVREIND